MFNPRDLKTYRIVYEVYNSDYEIEKEFKAHCISDAVIIAADYSSLKYGSDGLILRIVSVVEKRFVIKSFRRIFY